MLSYYQRNRAKVLAKNKMPEENKARNNRWLKHGRRLREEAVLAYGGYTCSCCGETEKHFLSIDHVKPVGTKNRLIGTQFYRWLKKQEYPEGYRILCMNCNAGRYRNGGECPHVTAKQMEELSAEAEVSFC